MIITTKAARDLDWRPFLDREPVESFFINMKMPFPFGCCLFAVCVRLYSLLFLGNATKIRRRRKVLLGWVEDGVNNEVEKEGEGVRAINEETDPSEKAK